MRGGGSGQTGSVVTTTITPTTPPSVATGNTDVTLKCPSGKTAAAGACFDAPTILASNVSIFKEDTFELLVTDVDGNFPTVVIPNATGSGYTIQASVKFFLRSPTAVTVADANGTVLPSTVVESGNSVPGVLGSGLTVTLKNSKIEYGKKYTFFLTGVVGAPNGNPLTVESVAYTTPTIPWSVPKVCGASKNLPCVIDSTCTVRNKCRLTPESNYFLANKADPSLVYVVSNLGPIPSQAVTVDTIRVYPAYAVSGKYINKVVPSSDPFLPSYGTTSGLIDYMFFGTDGFLYFSSISDRSGSRRFCARLDLWGDGGVSSRAQVEDSVCENGPPNSWSIPLGKEITLACTRTQRCALDRTSVYFAESPLALEREVGLGRAIVNTTLGYPPIASENVTVVTYYRNLGPNTQNGTFIFGGGFIPSYLGSTNKLGPIRSAFWDSGILYYELNQANLCMKFGDGVLPVNGETPVITCPQ